MIRNVSSKGMDFTQLERTLRSTQDGASVGGSASTGAAGVAEGAGAEGSFADMLAKSVKDVNSSVKESEQASMDLASGKSSNIHETMLAVTKAELGFNMLVQLRNKAIEAYQDVMRMQV